VILVTPKCDQDHIVKQHALEKSGCQVKNQSSSPPESGPWKLAPGTDRVVDPDPTGTGDLTKAAVVGRILLKTQPGTVTDHPVVANDGMGGQGILAVPVVYNGWVQNLPASFKQLLTPSQQNPH
jgi:hypothetical protein